MKTLTSNVILFIFVSTLAACGGGGGSANGGSNDIKDPSVAAATIILPPGDPDCPYGGLLVETGIDENGNGILDANEVDDTERVCNGAPGSSGSDGLNALTDMNPEPVGANCPNGGLRIDVGIDTNSNGSLDPDEINQTGFVCSGTNGNIGWQVATIIDESSNTAISPNVAMSQNGNAIAIWTQNDFGLTNIWVNHYTEGAGWGVAEMIENNSGAAHAPQVNINDSGNAVAVWIQFDGTRDQIWANHYEFGVGWNTAEPIETVVGGVTQSPEVAIDNSGNAVTVWLHHDGTRANIWANRYMPGFGWGSAELIENNNAGSGDKPQVAMDANGNSIAVWEQSDGIRNNIWSNRYVIATGWGAAELLETNDAGSVENPQVAMNASGSAVAVWEQFDGVRFNVWTNRFSVRSGWGSAELLELRNTGNSNSPSIVVDINGNAVAAWIHNDGTRFNAQANSYLVGTGWGTPEIIETNIGVVEGFISLAVDNSGNVLAAWTQADNIRFNVWANRYALGVGWAVAQLIETENITDARRPRLAMDSVGNGIVVWDQFDGVRFNIWANHFLIQ